MDNRAGMFRIVLKKNLIAHCKAPVFVLYNNDGIVNHHDWFLVSSIYEDNLFPP
jgi:hypothetical protein